MRLVDQAIARMEGQTLNGDEIDWRQWLKPSDVSRIIPAENLAAKAKEQILLGRGYEDGLTFPWGKTHGNVLIRPGKLAVWTGWSHHGKSQLLKMLMLWAIKHGHKVLIASMEEEVTDVWADLAIMYAGNDNPTPKILDEFVQFITGHLWLYDQQGVVEATRMQAVLRYAGVKLGISHSVIDSLMMLAVDRDDYDAQSRFVGELKSLSKDTQQTVHLVAHMRKRDGKTGETEPGGIHDIAGGHEIASKADYVFNVWRDKKPSEGKDDCILGVEKQRGHINWLGRIGLKFHKPSRQFIDGRYAIEFCNGQFK